MSTVRELIIDAFREAGIVATGEEPDADQFDEGLRRLNVIYDSLFGNEFGEPLTAANYGVSGLTNVYAVAEDMSSDITSAFVMPNTRLFLNLDAAATLYLNPHPADGERFSIKDNAGNLATRNVTVQGNGRLIESTASVVLNTNSLSRDWFYRDDLGSWVRVNDLTANDDSPFPSEFDDLLSTMLALRLNPRYGAQTSDEMVEVLKRARRMFRARYKQTKEQDSEIGLYRLTSNKRYWQWNNFNG